MLSSYLSILRNRAPNKPPNFGITNIPSNKMSNSIDQDGSRSVPNANEAQTQHIWSKRDFAARGSPELIGLVENSIGICAGTCIAWLRDLLLFSYHSNSMPELAEAVYFQQSLNYHGMSASNFARVGGMTAQSVTGFSRLFDALNHVWSTSGYYLILISTPYSSLGHCIACAPEGAVLNPNEGLFRCASVEAAYVNLTADPAIKELVSSPHGVLIRLVKVSRPQGQGSTSQCACTL